MQVVCSKCGELIGGDDLNVATDIARCPACDEVFPLSSLVQAAASGPVDLENPPPGAWYEADFNGFDVGSTTRHAVALFLVPFMCVWSGFSLGGIYGPQIVKGQLDLFQSLFGIPFLLGTLLFGAIALMSVCGEVVVRVRDSNGSVFTGVGPIGWHQRFDFSQVTGVRIDAYATNNTMNDHPNTMSIVLDGPTKLRFGVGLKEARRDFIANVLRQALRKRGQPRQGGL